MSRSQRLAQYGWELVQRDPGGVAVQRKPDRADQGAEPAIQGQTPLVPDAGV